MWDRLISYFSDQAAPADSPFVVAGLIAAGVVAVAGFGGAMVVRFLPPDRRNRLDVLIRLLGICRWAGLVLALIFVLRYEGLRPFHYRGWAWAALGVFAVWTVVVVRRDRAKLPQKRQQQVFADRYLRYLPKPKRPN